MTEKELDFSLPDREGSPAKKRSRSCGGVQWLILAGVIAIVAILVYDRRGAMTSSPAGRLAPDVLKQLAMKLENQDLPTVAAEAWARYVAAAGLSDPDAARIWYRIGVIYQKDEAYERALDAFYRSESFATLDGLDLEIARRTQECLETMGKFAALRRELSGRVGLGSGAGTDATDVVAEIGTTKITQADLDQRIEDQLNAELDRFASVLSPEDRNARKEEMLKQFSDPTRRMQFLNQQLMEELLYREAFRRDVSARDGVRRQLRDQERNLLAGVVLGEEVTDRVRITPSEVEAYYEAHTSDFVEKNDEGEEQPKSLDAVRAEIYRTMRMRKEQELQQALFEKWMSEYDVVIHRSAFTKDAP